MQNEIQLTFAPHGHVLTNVGVFSHDGRWIVYDVRPDRDGSIFEGTRIERVRVPDDSGRGSAGAAGGTGASTATGGQIEVLYESRYGACCGVATCCPTDERVVFLRGPERPTNDCHYGPSHRRGVIVRPSRPNIIESLDARDIIPPFTPGALRGGSHVHTFSSGNCSNCDGPWVSFTYNDHVLGAFHEQTNSNDVDLRNVGVAVPIPQNIAGGRTGKPPMLKVKPGPRNHDGTMFSVLVTRTTALPTPGTDEISAAVEDAWVGTNGYLRADGSRQRHTIAFQGSVVDEHGRQVSEVFIVDLPDDPRTMMTPGPAGPLEGTPTRRPAPPAGVTQRRLTRTAHRKYPGIQGPRHWLRSSPDGERIAFLARDDGGIVQLWTISPRGGEPMQVTHGAFPVASAFTWSPDGECVAYAADESFFIADVSTGQAKRMTPRDPSRPILPLAVVFSPDGRWLAYLRRIASTEGEFNQVFALPVSS